jgi:hypothetical protein
MNTVNQVTLGPYFTTAQQYHSVADGVVPLNLALEWSSAIQAERIDLCQLLSPGTPARVQLDQIVFHQENLPFHMECMDHQVVGVSGQNYLPLDALLAALYRSRHVCRPIYQILNELAGVIPLYSQVTNQTVVRDVLSPELESNGFRLNAIYRQPHQMHVQIAWQPESCSARLHVCTVNFLLDHGGLPNSGKWIPLRQIGVCQILAKELRRLVPGTPANLFSCAGSQLLGESCRLAAVAIA